MQNGQFTEDAWLTNNMHLHYQPAQFSMLAGGQQMHTFMALL